MISDLTVFKKSLLMANISLLAYTDNADFKIIGYESKEIINSGTYAYILWDHDDLIIAARGTDLSSISDVLSDLKVDLIKCPDTYGLVHNGFSDKTKNIWPEVYRTIKTHGNKKVWCTGHSSGAAIATIIAIKCHKENIINNPTLFTFGSPKVGNDDFVKYANSINLSHYRWVNCTDIITENPILPYMHHGIQMYFDANGKFANLSTLRLLQDKFIGYLKNINPISYHGIVKYISNLKKLT